MSGRQSLWKLVLVEVLSSAAIAFASELAEYTVLFLFDRNKDVPEEKRQRRSSKKKQRRSKR